MKNYLAAAALLCVFAPLSLQAQEQAPYRHGPKAGPNATTLPQMDPKPPVPPSKAVNVTYAGHTVTLTVEDLLNLPQVTVHVHNSHRHTEETYSGPLVADVLAKAGLVSSKETDSLILHSNIVATGTDKYFVLYSAAEVEPGFSTGKVIVAVMKEGLPNTEGGVIQIVNTTDAKPARWIHGLANLNVMSLAQNP